MKVSRTLYVGNISFFTREEQIYEFFSKAGPLKRVIMGLDRKRLQPCGFCFVEYFSRKDAENAQICLSGARLDGRIVRADWDAGFVEGRQFGRGKSGGQVRDEFREHYDSGRGGLGRAALANYAESRESRPGDMVLSAQRRSDMQREHQSDEPDSKRARTNDGW